jgi:hypothetical protein
VRWAAEYAYCVQNNMGIPSKFGVGECKVTHLLDARAFARAHALHGACWLMAINQQVRAAKVSRATLQATSYSTEARLDLAYIRLIVTYVSRYNSYLFEISRV